MRVLHVQGKNLKEINAPYEFLNGDVYVVDNSDVSVGLKKKVYIWLGSQAFADDRAVGAWAAKCLDLEDEEIDIDTEVEGNESEEFKGLLDFVVVTGDTPGFLKHVEVNKEDISYALYRVRDIDLTDGSSSDDIVIENIPLTRESFVSDDVFVLDAYHDLYVWVGSQAQVGEKAAGNRLVRKFDVERERNPMVYTISEGYEPKGFFELVNQLADSGEVRTEDAADVAKGITGSIADLSSETAETGIVTPVTPRPEPGHPPVTPPPELERPLISEPIPRPPIPEPEPEYTPPPLKTPIPTPQPEPKPVDLGLGPTGEPAPKAKAVKLYYIDGEFGELGGNEDAVLEIDEGTRVATLSFAEGTSLIAQRTAGRQARGICKAGFLLKAGYRVGQNCDLREVKGERGIHDRLLQEGHKYK
ncbi:MAG: hypothetical protein JSW11_09770 [Candidatus Heimdallarchaeota archaeon]|nr:MAG: hypothetical protein JSW11_09770 [Candidatus Heimdallarchaeota archaeon]